MRQSDNWIYELNVRWMNGIDKGKRSLLLSAFMREGITIKDIAARIARKDDSLSSVIERLRYWTKVGVLRPIGDKHGGTGRWNTYSQEEVYIAAIVAEMAAFRLPTGRLVSAADWLRVFTHPQGPGTTSPRDHGGHSADWHREALAGKRESYICLRHGIDSFTWLDRKQMNRQVNAGAMIVIPVHEVVKGAVSR